ncbi:MAG: iron ABC transporter permease, partial [Pseudomonadota bacterium]
IPIFSAIFTDQQLSEFQKTVLLELRVPRILLAAMVGTALSAAGASLQGLFRNPLAEPQLIGVSSGAALGAISMIVLGSRLGLPEYLGPYSLPIAAMLGALLVTTALYGFARSRGESGIATMLLVGIAINAIASVGIGFFTWIANDGELRSLTFWTLGSFGGAQWDTALPAIIFIALALGALLPNANQLDVLQLGETEAKRLGVSVPRLKKRVVFGAAAAVGAGVAVSGIIAFVGLIVPHVARMLGGVHHGYLIPGSALLGASLMVTADLGARTIVVPAEMPVGLITSAIGAPFFLWLIVRLRGRR